MLSASSGRGRQVAAALRRGHATAVAAAGNTAAPQEATDEWRRARPFEDIPGPKALPIVGNVWRFLLPTGDFKGLDMLQVVHHMRDKYGDISKLDGIPGRPPLVFLFNANDIEKVYRNEGTRPVRDSIQSLKFYREVTRRDLFGDVQGVAFTQGEQWYEFRRRVNQPMMQPRSSKLYVPSIDQVAQDFTDRMLAIRDESMKMPPDFLNELNKWALESISLVALDTRLGCLDGNLPPDSEPQRMIEAAHTVFDCLLQLDLKPSPWRYVSTPAWRRLVTAQDYFYQVALRHINDAMDRMKKRGAAEAASGELSVLEKLLVSNDDPRVAVVMALDMMFAGIDTTSNAAGTALYFLSTNQRAQEQLYQEVRAQLPDSASQPLTADKVEACKYLKACVKESMRGLPTVGTSVLVLWCWQTAAGGPGRQPAGGGGRPGAQRLPRPQGGGPVDGERGAHQLRAALRAALGVPPRALAQGRRRRPDGAPLRLHAVRLRAQDVHRTQVRRARDLHLARQGGAPLPAGVRR